MLEMVKTSTVNTQDRDTDRHLARALVERKALSVDNAKSLLASLQNGDSNKSLEDLLLESELVEEDVILD